MKKQIDRLPDWLKSDSKTKLLRDEHSTIFIETEERFISDIFNYIPGKCILDKELPGVGLTTFVQKSSQNTFILGPYKNYLNIDKEGHELFIFRSDTPLTNVNFYIDECIKKEIPYKVVCIDDSFHKLESTLSTILNDFIIIQALLMVLMVMVLHIKLLKHI